MAGIANHITDLIGNTPLVRISHHLNPGKAEIVVKVESFNPGGSVKDRVGYAMIEAAEQNGTLQPGALIIEPTSGNTGIGLAITAAVKGYKLILVMPDTMSIERRKLLEAYGAKLILTPGNEGMTGAIRTAQELRDKTPGAWIPQQFSNPANPEAHAHSTAEEIWRDTDGHLDAFIAGVGTGGTITGVGHVLKQRNPNLKIIAVEPDTSAVLSGNTAGPHKLQGIGAGFIPDVLDISLLDRIIPVSADNAGNTARQCAIHEGILTGISGGAALYAAIQLSMEHAWEGKRIITLLPDSGERYLSTWLFD